MGNRIFKYHFIFSDNKVFDYQVNLDENLHSLPKKLSQDPKVLSVCDLNYCKCENCPLTSNESPLCPSAKAMTDLIPKFENMNSYERCTVRVSTPNREYSKECDIQHGLQSLFGLVLATSGCPHMDFLRTMAKFHLPFSNTEETIIRSLSYYLLKAFSKDSKMHNFSLDTLRENYEKLSIVNIALCKRISKLETLDASKNALIVLDTFSQMFKAEFALNFEDIEEYLN